MADAKAGVEYTITLKDATQTGAASAAKTVEDAARKAQGAASEAVESIAQRAGRLPGVLGQVQNALGGILGKSAAVIGAFKVGWDIGSWIYDKVITPLFKIKDPIEELKRENREMQREWEKSFEAYGESLKKWADHWDREVEGAEKARQVVEDLTKAYLAMHAARERSAAAQDDATMISMQRDKLAAMAGAASPEEAAALGKRHDILIAEEKARQELAKFDREAEASAQRQANAEEQLLKAQDKRGYLARQMVELDRKVAYAESDKATQDLGFEGANKLEETLKRERETLRRELDQAERDEGLRRNELAAMRASGETEAQERRNIEERARLEIDEKKKAYDDYIAEVEAEEARMAEEEWQRQQEEIRREAELELSERKKIESELAAQRVANLRKELQERSSEQAAAEQRLSAAKSQVSRAWGWYRNKDSLRAQLDEEKADAAAQAQFEKDFDRLRFRRDWREAKNLSLDQEAVRRVALAKEDEAAAEKAAIETAADARRAADSLEAIEAALSEG